MKESIVGGTKRRRTKSLNFPNISLNILLTKLDGGVARREWSRRHRFSRNLKKNSWCGLKVEIEPGREMPGWKEKDSLGRSRGFGRARARTHMVDRGVGGGGVGCRSRACESPNGTHASFDKLWEHTYIRGIRASGIAVRIILRNARFNGFLFSATGPRYEKDPSKEEIIHGVWLSRDLTPICSRGGIDVRKRPA